jgi:tripartite-type tricarboxylate transporter receptor subunit TctC
VRADILSHLSRLLLPTATPTSALAVAMDQRHPLMPDVPTFKELGVEWVDGAYRGIGMPKSSMPEQRKRMSDLWASLNNDPEMKEIAAKKLGPGSTK